MNPTIKLFIVDDHPFFRQGVRFYLETLEDVDIIGEADNGRKALKAVAGLLEAGNMDAANLVILMDLQMPEMNGIETTRALLEIDSRIKVLVLTSQGDSQAVHEAMAVGAAGFCLKDAPPQELENAVRGVHGGGAYLGKGVLPHLLKASPSLSQTLVERNKATDTLESLTPRERDVLVLLARGLSNKAIGEVLFVSEKTVKTHVANLFGKLMVTSRTQAALWAQHQGLDKEEI